MPEEPTPGETPTVAPEQPAGETPQAVPEGASGEPFDPERAMATIRNLREFEKEAKQLRKKVADHEKAEDERKKAEMTEMERLQAELQEAQASLAKRQLDDQKRAIAKAVGLPDELALRIQGANEDEMKADAELLVAAIPKPDPKKPNLGPTNPGSGAVQGETDEQRRRRLGI
jgi:hypothetical protein